MDSDHVRIRQGSERDAKYRIAKDTTEARERRDRYPERPMRIAHMIGAPAFEIRSTLDATRAIEGAYRG